MQGSNPCPLAYKFGEGMVDRGRKISESEGRYHNAMRYLVYLTLPHRTPGGVCEVETDGRCCVHLKPDAALQNNGWWDE